MTEPIPSASRRFSRRTLLAGSVAAAAAGAFAGAAIAPVVAASADAPRAKGLIDPGLAGQHPRLILGTRVPLTELQRRVAAPAYAPFVASLTSYASARPALPTITGVGNDGQWETVYWALPELALAHVITGDAAYATKVHDWTMYVVDRANFPVWGGESGGSMGNAVALIAIAIAYDWCHGIFSDGEKKTIRDRLAVQTDTLIAQFGNTTVATDSYWKLDPQPNHRHFRIGGIVAAAAAIHGDGADDSGESDDFRLEFGRNQLRHTLGWIAPDGSEHESITYANFGNEHLIRSIDILDGIGSGNLWADPEVPGMGRFKIDMSLPGFPAQFSYGDTDGSLYYFNPYLWRIASRYGDRALQDFLHRLYASGPAGVSSFFYNAWNILWHDDSLSASGLDDRPATQLYPDLGIVATRTSWQADAVSLHTKAGVVGGRRLNEWRDRLGPNSTYVNVAHDHPDGGHFSVSFGGAVFGAYAPYGAYLTKYTNGIVAGADVGQAGESASYFQPYPDMRDRASIPAVCALGSDTVTVTDSSGLYAAPSASGLTRARRTIAFVDRELAIVVDDVTASSPRAIHSLFHSKGVATDVSGGSDIAQTVGTGTVTARYLASSPDAGASSTRGPGLLPAMGTTWRTTVPAATAAHFAAAVVPQRTPDDAATLAATATESQVSATLTRPQSLDTVVMASSADGRGPVQTEQASADARALLVHATGEGADADRVTAVDASVVRFAGFEIAIQGDRRNLRVAVADSGVTVTVDAVLPGSAAGGTILIARQDGGAVRATVDARPAVHKARSGKLALTLSPGSMHTLDVRRA